MGKGIKTGGKNFEKGNTYGGRKPLPKDIKAARSMSYEDMCRTVIEVRNMTVGDTQKEDQKDMTLGKRAIVNAFAKLDYRGIKDYEDRLWGKAKDFINVELPEGVEIIIQGERKKDNKGN